MESTESNVLARTRQSQNRLTKQEVDQTMERLRHLSFLLDSAFRIPILGYRSVGTQLSDWCRVWATRSGCCSPATSCSRRRGSARPKACWRGWFTTLRWKTIIGAIPIIGDLFDAVFKANIRNVKLLERALNS